MPIAPVKDVLFGQHLEGCNHDSLRTTVTIDADTEFLIREEVKRTGLSFKEVLNQSIRRALLQGSSGSRPRVKPIFPADFPKTEHSFNRLGHMLDDEEIISELRR